MQEKHGKLLGFVMTTLGLLYFLFALPCHASLQHEGRAFPGQRRHKQKSERISSLASKSERARTRARLWAQAQGMPVVSRMWRGTEMQLMDVLGNRPVYFTTFNHHAAIASGAAMLQDTLDFDLDGTGFTIGLWDQNMPLDSHQEFQSDHARITLWDAPDISDHSTNVAGTLGAVGIDLNAMGMAPNVHIDAYNWEHDLSEMTAVAASGPNEPDTIYVSNHSYGMSSGWAYTDLSGDTGWHWMAEWDNAASVEPVFGQYGERTSELDELTWHAPYYLPFMSAGNDRNDNPDKGVKVYYPTYRRGKLVWKNKKYDNQCPLGDGRMHDGYDTLHSSAVAKNVLTVGAVAQTLLKGVRNITHTEVTVYSAFGPTDDGRVKPDLVAQGNSLYTTSAGSKKAYGRASGTSLSCPSASGSAMLLVQYYDRLFKGQAMRASTLKGLLLHTADDLLAPGPDYQTGWGLINVQASAELLRLHSQDSASPYIIEADLSEMQAAHTYDVVLDNPNGVTFTLCWTDPNAQPTEKHDDNTSTLIHDLDLRVLGSNMMYLPYTLNPMEPEKEAVPGDNVLDNVEQIVLKARAPGLYTIQITRKHILTTPVQWYSLISDVPLLNGKSIKEIQVNLPVNTPR